MEFLKWNLDARKEDLNRSSSLIGADEERIHAPTSRSGEPAFAADLVGSFDLQLWTRIRAMNPAGTRCRASKPVGRSALPNSWKVIRLLNSITLGAPC